MEIKTSFIFNVPLDDTMQFEKIHPENVQLKLSEKQELRNAGAEFIYLRGDHTGSLIGETYYIEVDNMKNLSADLQVENISEWTGKKAIYCYSNTILPKYQRQGLGAHLKEFFLKHAEGKGFQFSIGHARSAGSIELNESFGAKRIHDCPNWQGTGETYFFYSQQLQELTRIILKTRIQHAYEQIKRTICPAQQVDYPSANIVIELLGSDSRYNPETEEFIISLPGDYEIGEFRDDDHRWQVWKVDLIHEMVHEYQYKVKPDASDNGTALFNQFQLTSEKKKPGQYYGFSEKGHDAVFYTCVDLFADCFNLSGEELITNRVKHI
jgi:GNAT superfamily N-acetyltransferase